MESFLYQGEGPNLAGDSQFLSKFPPQLCSDDYSRMFVYEYIEGRMVKPSIIRMLADFALAEEPDTVDIYHHRGQV